MNSSIAKQIGELLQLRGGSLVTAESCTGGLVAECCTNNPGASSWYLGGWVTYSNAMKISQLHVPEELLEEFGAVSTQVAKAMCSGARERSGAVAALSTTGIAGPSGGTEAKPIGTVFIGCSLLTEMQIKKCLFTGNREEVREKATNAAMQLLYDMLSDEKFA